MASAPRFCRRLRPLDRVDDDYLDIIQSNSPVLYVGSEVVGSQGLTADGEYEVIDLETFRSRVARIEGGKVYRVQRVDGRQVFIEPLAVRGRDVVGDDGPSIRSGVIVRFRAECRCVQAVAALRLDAMVHAVRVWVGLK